MPGGERERGMREKTEIVEARGREGKREILRCERYGGSGRKGDERGREGRRPDIWSCCEWHDLFKANVLHKHDDYIRCCKPKYN